LGSDLRRLGAIAAALVAGPSGVAAAATPLLQIRGAAVRVAIVPEARRDIVVVVVKGSARLPLRMRRVGDRLTLLGDVSRRVHGCGRAASPVVAIWGRGTIRYSELPFVVVRTPLDVRVLAGDAVFGVIGRSHGVELENLGCGSWTIANTRARLRVEQAGSGEIRTGAAGQADLTVAGDGRILAGAVSGPLAAVSSGSGDVTVASAAGTADLRVGGTGDVAVNGGAISRLKVSIAGSGDIQVRAPAGTLSASVTGSGNVDVASVNGPVERRVFGSGAVRVGRR
jgi:hypothetical protein